MAARNTSLYWLLFALLFSGVCVFSQEPETKKKPKRPPLLEALPFDSEVLARVEAGKQMDFPSPAVSPSGEVYVAYVDYDGKQDQLRVARKEGDQLQDVATVGQGGIIHQPALTIDLLGNVWCFWGQTVDDVVELRVCRIAENKPGEIITLSRTGGSETFVYAAVCPNGKVWITWQSMRHVRPDIYTRYFDPESGKWSDEIAVAQNNEGDWEPKISFDNDGNAWIIYDSAKGNEFNLYLAKVGLDGAVETFPIAHSSRYEARASIEKTVDGKGFWIAAERGKVRWGLDSRGHNNATGINAGKMILFGYFSIADQSFREMPLGHAGQAGAPVNLPTVGVAADGSPWVAYRYFERALWRIAVTRYDKEKKSWSSRRRIDGGSFGQDRTSHFLSAPDGKMWFCWSSDKRKTKAAGESGVYLAAIDPKVELPPANPGHRQTDGGASQPFAPSQETPERAWDDRYKWNLEGTEYGLFWGDVHRHTDVSNCRTGFDGCINEHFRYAYDIGKLDFMGTSDHTDVGKIYAPYEWWHNQKMHDVFHTPGRFNSLYVYEREQRWPWGHRNVVFAERGGPVVYIQRTRYRNSIWQKSLPAPPGVGEITPYELWEILDRSGKKVALVSHTGATGMGTDWGRYDRIDYSMENLVEIFQGARVSYEGEGLPQPTAGHKPGELYTIAANDQGSAPPPAPIEDFGKYKNGTYQHALSLHRRLGVFASSDHISCHVSYGGVYCEDFTREGIIEAFNARRTIAATDKIFLNFTCNGKPLGSIFSTTGKPQLWCRVDGTAKLKRVTIIRNEKNWKTFTDISSHQFETKVTDDNPPEGENRYYIRVEQEDGNMAWSSPVWVVAENG